MVSSEAVAARAARGLLSRDVVKGVSVQAAYRRKREIAKVTVARQTQISHAGAEVFATAADRGRLQPRPALTRPGCHARNQRPIHPAPLAVFEFIGDCFNAL
jgi:hypothetical protein